MQMNNAQQYRLFNGLMGIALSLVFIYPLLFSKLDANQQIYCVHKVWLNKPCNSCGITHDFKHILKGTYFKQQVLQNEHSIKVFLFFVSLLLSRIVLSMCSKKIVLKSILTIDITWHICLAIYAFSGFWYCV